MNCCSFWQTKEQATPKGAYVLNSFRDLSLLTSACSHSVNQGRNKCDNAIFNVKTEQQVERNRIVCLIDLKRSQLPNGGTPEEREVALALRQEIHNLDYQMQLNDINSQKKLNDLRHDKKVAINNLLRQWETAVGTLKQALVFVCEKARQTAES